MLVAILCSLFACKAVPNVPPVIDEPELTASTAPEETVERSEKLSAESEEALTQEEAAQQACIESCVASRQMEAVAIEMIQESCAKGCMKENATLSLEEEGVPVLAPQ